MNIRGRFQPPTYLHYRIPLHQGQGHQETGDKLRAHRPRQPIMTGLQLPADADNPPRWTVIADLTRLENRIVGVQRAFAQAPGPAEANYLVTTIRAVAEAPWCERRAK